LKKKETEKRPLLQTRLFFSAKFGPKNRLIHPCSGNVFPLLTRRIVFAERFSTRLPAIDVFFGFTRGGVFSLGFEEFVWFFVFFFCFWPNIENF
jgi:hypothetical protein